MTSFSNLPDPTTCLSLDDFLHTLPPLASNPPDERTAFLAQFDEEIGVVSSLVLSGAANHFLEFGIPPAGPPDLGDSLTKQKDATVKLRSGPKEAERTDAGSAPTGHTPRPQSTRPPSWGQSSHLSTQQGSDCATEKARSVGESRNTDICDFEEENGFSSRSDAMTVPRQAESIATPANDPETMAATDLNVGSGATAISDRVIAPAPVPNSYAASKPIQAYSSQFAPSRYSSLANWNANEGMMPAHAKVPVFHPVPGGRLSDTSAPIPPLQPGGVTAGEGSFTSVSSNDAQGENAKKSKKKNYCPYCKKYFEKDLRKHIADNFKCDNKDKLAVHGSQGSLVPHASPNLHIKRAATPGQRPLLPQDYIVLIPATVAPGGELLQDSQSGYVHMQYGGRR